MPEGKEFPDNALLVGVSARVVRTISESDVPILRINAEIYHHRWQRYREELQLIK